MRELSHRGAARGRRRPGRAPARRVSRSFIPEAAANGTTCIDNSSAFRMDPDVPLSIPEVNPEALDGDPPRGSSPYRTARRSPRCSRSAPLHRAAGLTSARAVVLPIRERRRSHRCQRAPRAGREAPRRRGVARPSRSRRACPSGRCSARRSPTTCVAKIGEFEADGFTGEETKMMAEPRKILGLPDLPVVATRGPRARGGRSRRVDPGGVLTDRSTWPRRVELLRRRTRRGALGRPRARRLPVADRRRRARRGAGGSHPAGARPRRRARVVQLRRQPPQGRGAGRVQIAEHLFVS